MTIIGISNESWIEQLSPKEQDKFLKLVDSLVIVGNCTTHAEPPYYFIRGVYEPVRQILQDLSVCKAYPQKTLFSSNFALVEIKDGMSADDLRKEWLHELRCRGLV